MAHKSNPTPERWHEIERLFEQALALPAADRAAFLAAACADDRSLRREVESLLASHDAPGPLDAIERDVVASLHAHVRADPMEGRTVGPYRLVRALGYGGMGAVYLAERVGADFEQRVALKLIRFGAASAVLRRRFVRERQILARLEHPHIARFLDGGVTGPVPGEPGGQPYLAMEYVEGRPITAYADAHRLSITERIRLFKAVCGAVHYAHQHLVVHRDLKPLNILVTDGGRVKLLDFGVAKLLEQDDDAEALTQTGLRVMTPEYAAPEQVRGEPITTATDIYSLGVVLYELLTGHRPYEMAARSPVEVERIICETPPPRPSTAVLQTREVQQADGETRTVTPAEVSQARRVPPERLQRRLVGDLDMIVLKALAKEPGRRYASAEALMEDLNRHLARLPVHAQGDSAGYRLRKFVQRHRQGVTVTALVAAALLAGLAGTAWQAQVAARERDRARLEAAKAEEVAAFLVDLFKEADPAEARGDTMHVFDLLARGTSRVGAELAGQPELQSTLLYELGEVYRSMGQFDRARPLLENALAIRREALGADHPDVADAMMRLGMLVYAQGAYTQADSLYRAALGLYRRTYGEQHEDVASAHNNLAALNHSQGHLDSAEHHYRAAIALRERLGRGDPLDLAVNMAGLAVLLKNMGALAAADSLQRRVLAIYQAHLEADHPDLANELNNRGTLLVAMGDLDGAEAALREALAIQRKVYRGGHVRVARTMNNLGAVLERKERLDEAASFYEESYTLKRALVGEVHPSTAISLSNLGLVRWKLGDLAAAEQTLRDSWALHRQLRGDAHPRTAQEAASLAELQCEQGATPEAEAALQRALEVIQEAYPEANEGAARVQSALGGCLLRSGRYEEAERLLLAAYPQLREAHGAQHEQTLQARRRLADLYEQQGDTARAARYGAPIPEGP